MVKNPPEIQETQVRSLIQEDHAGWDATNAHAPQLLRLSSRAGEPPSPEARVPTAHGSATGEATAMRSPCTATGEWAPLTAAGEKQQQRPSIVKINK